MTTGASRPCGKRKRTPRTVITRTAEEFLPHARNDARYHVARLLPSWGYLRMSNENGHTRIVAGDNDRLVAEFDDVELADVPPNVLNIIRSLQKELFLQGLFAGYAAILAVGELTLHAKRIRGASLGGTRSARNARRALEQLMRAALARGEDPRERFGAWHAEYGYSRQQLQNILKAVREGHS